MCCFSPRPCSLPRRSKQPLQSGRPHMSLADCDSLGVMKPFRSRSTKQLNNFGVMEPLDSRHMEASALK